MKNLYEQGQMIETSVAAISNDTVFIDFGLKIEGTSSCGKDWRGCGAVPERSAGMKAEAATPESLFFAQIRCGGDGQKAAQNKKNG